jgi:hypothetical protein
VLGMSAETPPRRNLPPKPEGNVDQANPGSGCLKAWILLAFTPTLVLPVSGMSGGSSATSRPRALRARLACRAPRRHNEP